ncbi:MAG: hypothetical protein H7Z74_10915 [Anaerolineae bacterium]|nr:hypothetical protein [Gemmatimonadaceae bacterium]
MPLGVLFLAGIAVSAGALLSLFHHIRMLRARLTELEAQQAQTLELVSSLVVDGAGPEAVKQTLSALLRQPPRIP